jgi:hypothetical protein
MTVVPAEHLHIQIEAGLKSRAEEASRGSDPVGGLKSITLSVDGNVCTAKFDFSLEPGRKEVYSPETKKIGYYKGYFRYFDRVQ